MLRDRVGEGDRVGGAAMRAGRRGGAGGGGSFATVRGGVGHIFIFYPLSRDIDKQFSRNRAGEREMRGTREEKAGWRNGME